MQYSSSKLKYQSSGLKKIEILVCITTLTISEQVVHEADPLKA